MKMPPRSMIASLSLALIAPIRVAAAQAPADSQRMVLRTGASCHALPDSESPLVERYRIGDVIGASKSTQGMGRRPWYFDAWRVKGIAPTCWIDGLETVPFQPGNSGLAWAAAADKMLGRKDVTFDEYVELIARLEARPNYGPDSMGLLRRFPMLQFKFLLLMEEALDRVDRYSAADAPLKLAWIVAHQDLVQYHEPAARWVMPASRYWAVFETNETAPWAEELAWAAAKKIPAGDECYADCHLNIIATGPQQYWMRFPAGKYVVAALARADTFAANALATARDEPPTLRQIVAIRIVLGPVQSAEKARLLDLLAQLERLAKPPSPAE